MERTDSTTSSKFSSIKSINFDDNSSGFSNEFNIFVQIQTERITAILNELIVKAEISIFLLLHNEEKEDDEFLKKYLSSTEMALVDKIRNKVFDIVSDGKLEKISEEHVQKMIACPGSKMYPDLSEIIWTVYKNIELKNAVKAKINLNKSGALSYLDALIKFKNRMIERVNMNAAEKLKKDLFSNNLDRMNKTLKTQIEDVSVKMENDKEVFEKIFNEKEEIIRTQQNELDNIKKDCSDVISQKIHETNQKIDEATSSHCTKYELLTSKLQEAKDQLESALQKHLEEEYKYRTERISVENKLTSLLADYDEVVGGKQTNLDNLTTDYEEEKRQFVDLQKLFFEQEEEYVPLMAEKEAEYQREILTKMTTFLMEHAARVIQRAWRKILASRAEKKKGKRAASKKKKVKE